MIEVENIGSIVEELLKEHGITYKRVGNTLYSTTSSTLDVNRTLFANFPIFINASIIEKPTCKMINIADPDFIDKLKKKIEICNEQRSRNTNTSTNAHNAQIWLEKNSYSNKWLAWSSSQCRDCPYNNR